MTDRPFPPDFLFGCATSAYQIEGGIDNDWARWEAAGRLKDPSARCGLATDHWNRWAEDVDHLDALGAQAYRFSVEWARVEPQPGRFDEAAIARYVEIVDALNGRGIRPMVTLLHFTHPAWFYERCPWHDSRADGPKRFGAFAARMAAAFGKRVGHYTVLNEPAVWLAAAYWRGAIPPGVRSTRQAIKATFGLVRAHAAAHRAIKAEVPEAQVGIAKHYVHFTASSRFNPLERLAAFYAGDHFNHLFLRALTDGVVQFGMLPGTRIQKRIPEAAGTLDFIGVNYYSRLYVALAARLGPEALNVFYEDRNGRGVSDLGWEIYPAGLTEALLDLHRYGRPMFITENGLDDRTDQRRAAFIHAHLGAVLDAISAGADVRGYLHWSLLDNFEWLEAYEPRFGLHRVDYQTMARTLTEGGAYYRDVIAARALQSRAPAAKIRPGWGRVTPG